MEACDFCREINGNKTPCWICSLGNPCLGCEDYYIGESEKDSKCLSNGGCAENKENTDETIDADALNRQCIEGDGDDKFTEGYNFAVTEIKGYIADSPTIEERKTGKWIWNGGGYDCRCNLCNVSPLSYTDACGLDGGSIMTESMEFCPHCGAKMELPGLMKSIKQWEEAIDECGYIN